MHAETNAKKAGSKKAKKSPAKKGAAKVTTTAAEPLAPEVVGSEKAYRDFEPVAASIAAKDVEVCRADIHLAHHNLTAGVAAVLAAKDRIASALPEVDVTEIVSLPDLSLATVYAAAQVDMNPHSTSDVRQNLAKARPLRRTLLSAARALREAGVFTANEVARIERGAGAIDAAQDCVDLAALFRQKAAATKGKTTVTAAQINDAATLGTTLLGQLRPAAAGKNRVRPADVKAAAATRDKLWTLLLQRWDVLWRAGAYLFGKDAVDAAVPALQSRYVAPKKLAKPAAGTGIATAPADK